MMKQRTLGDWLLLTMLVVVWGASFAATRIAVTGLSPLWVMALRLCVGALALYGLMRLQGRRLPVDRTALLWYAWLGFVGSVAPFFLISWGAQHLPSGLVGVTMGLVPLMTLGMAHFMLPDESLGPGRILGFVAGFVGLLALMAPQLPTSVSFDEKTLAAQIAIILATSGYALQLVTARKSPVMPFIEKSTGVVIAAAVCGLALALVLEPNGLGASAWRGLATWRALAAIIMLGVFPTALAALILFRLVDHSGPSFVALSNYLIPPFAYVFGIVTLGESFEWSALVGLLIILAGVYLAERQQ